MSDPHRPYLRSSTKQGVQHNAEYTQKNEQNELVDPNTGEPLGDNVQYGHVTGMENKGFIDYAKKSGMSQKELNNTVNNPGLYQLENGHSNMGHQFEEQDPNQTALNTANYCYLENPEYQQNTYINPPSAENDSWTISVVNKTTGVESQVGTFQPDLGEISAESQASIQSAVSSAETDHDASAISADAETSTSGTTDDDSNTDADDDGMCM